MTKSQSHKYLLYVPIDDEQAALMLARQLIQDKLAACVNLIPKGKSIYEWEGKIQESCELIMIVKTNADQLEKALNYLIENHPYDTPAIISLPVEFVSQGFENWWDKCLNP